MISYETPNYIFHYQENSTAEKDIWKIAKLQESCFEYISNLLKVTLNFKIEYYLCETPDDVGQIYGDDEPCNGFACSPNKIYAVYNDEIKCLGFHEDAHIVSYVINTPNVTAIREGLAMYFDRKWWGIQNLDWAGHYIKTGEYISVKELLDNEVFDSKDCSITYPIMGAFTDWLISTYGIDKYLQFYKHEDSSTALELVYNWTQEELNKAFVDYVRLFEIDEVLEKRMLNLSKCL